VTGICRTDARIVNGDLPPHAVSYPCIPGHELSGTVVSTGAGVAGLGRGDRVVVEGRISCGVCPRCVSGRTNLCRRNRQLGFTLPGGFGEFVAAPANVVHAVPDDLSLAAASVVEPAASVMRAIRRAGLVAGESAGIVGIGSLGAAALMLIRHLGCRPTVAYGIRTEELMLAEQLGADYAIDVADADAVGRSKGPAGRGLDAVIEVAGTVSAVRTALEVVRPGGRVVLLGLPGPGRALELDVDSFVRKDVELIGSLSYTSSAFAEVLSLAVEGVIDFDQIITHRFPFGSFREAFAKLDEKGRVAKVVIEHLPE
jgi:2-desacetyl-2-hydroxyethyl bacteriochlorophyllide A dehydrogenase